MLDLVPMCPLGFTVLQGTVDLISMCPLFRGSTVLYIGHMTTVLRLDLSGHGHVIIVNEVIILLDNSNQ